MNEADICVSFGSAEGEGAFGSKSGDMDWGGSTGLGERMLGVDVCKRLGKPGRVLSLVLSSRRLPLLCGFFFMRFCRLRGVSEGLSVCSGLDRSGLNDGLFAAARDVGRVAPPLGTNGWRALMMVERKQKSVALFGKDRTRGSHIGRVAVHLSLNAQRPAHC